MIRTILFCLSLFTSSLFGLGFGSMGNTSAGLGDSGVALRKSAWGIYYNPALLASDNRGKFGYSFGINVDEKGLDEILTAFLDSQHLNINDLYNRFQANPKNTLKLNSQNGIVIQITGGTYKVPKLDAEGKPIKKPDADGQLVEEVIEKRNPYGAFTIAAFLSLHTLGDVRAKLTGVHKDQLNIDGKLSGLALAEIPIGWGWRFETDAGDVSVGMAIKYMGATSLDSTFQAMTDQSGETMSSFALPSQFYISHWFGIDLGLLYTPIEGLNLGLVAKNINFPSFDLYGRKFTIDPQFRLGLSYEFAKYFALTFDSDLAPNRILFENSPKTQMIGGGLLMDFKYIDLRFGLMGDMANKFEQGVIMTGGINLLGFLDVALQASSSMFDVMGHKVPKYISLKVGGSFTF